MLNSNFDLYKREWLDLVFTDRNKNYGAYDLRKHSGEYTMRAMAITLACFAGAIIMIKVFNKPQDQTRYIIRDVAPKTYIAPKVKNPEEVHVAKVNHPKTQVSRPVVHTPMQQFQVPKPTDDRVPDLDIPKQTEITNSGPITSRGDDVKQTTVIDTPPGNGTQGSTGTEIDNSTYTAGGVDVMPEPVGGMAAWSKFLQKNIRYPDTDNEGKVFLSFIIEKDGHLSNITLLRGVSPLLDEEAMRVLKLAPAWKPGKQNGQSVRVRYTLPIVFQVSQ